MQFLHTQAFSSVTVQSCDLIQPRGELLGIRRVVLTSVTSSCLAFGKHLLLR